MHVVLHYFLRCHDADNHIYVFLIFAVVYCLHIPWQAHTQHTPLFSAVACSILIDSQPYSYIIAI